MFLNFQVNLIVNDVEPCVAFYKAIGFEQTYRFPADGPAAHVEVRMLGLTLGIGSIAAAREVHGLDLAGAGNAVHVCFECDDMDAAFARMLQAGARTFREPRDFQGGRLRNVWVLDPAGNLIELYQQRG